MQAHFCRQAHCTYDALDRLTETAYSGASSLTVLYDYDQTGTGFGYGVGHLTGITDAAGTIARSYDERGNMLTEKRTSGSTTLTTTYTYDANSRVASITYPSGAVSSYTRDATGVIDRMPFSASGADASVTVYGATHEPFGPVTQIEYDNDDTDNYTYDLDYRNTAISSTAATWKESLSYGYDYANNLTSITDGYNAANSQTFTYDALNRLTGAVSGTGGYGTLGWTYDASGNRLTQTGSAVSYGYTSDSNRLATVNPGTSASVTTNANGNITNLPYGSSSGTSVAATYSAANRLATATPSGGTGGTYTYDAFGRRFKKTVGSYTWLYTYDQWGNLLEEKMSPGDTTDYIYMDGQEVGIWNPTLGHVYFAHTDRIGTPTAVNDIDDDTVWKVTWQPFGAYQTYYAPEVTNSLAFPGQYFDSETGWFYNLMRDYNPALGRYVETDPIGLNGGVNTYGYVFQNPQGYVDPWGIVSEYLYVGRVPVSSVPSSSMLDPTGQNPAALSPLQQQQISNTLSDIDQGLASSHPYRNLPNTDTGAQMPQCPAGYRSYDVDPVSRKNRGLGRLYFPNDVSLSSGGTIYYSPNHSQSYYPILLLPAP